MNNLLHVLLHLIYPNVENDNWRETGLLSQPHLCIMHIYRQPRSHGALLPVLTEREMGRRENLGTWLVYRHSITQQFIMQKRMRKTKALGEGARIVHPPCTGLGFLGFFLLLHFFVPKKSFLKNFPEITTYQGALGCT